MAKTVIHYMRIIRFFCCTYNILTFSFKRNADKF